MNEENKQIIKDLLIKLDELKKSLRDELKPEILGSIKTELFSKLFKLSWLKENSEKNEILIP